MKLTRDSALLWVGVIAALFAYLSVNKIPTEWSYPEWIQFGIAITGWAIGKLQSSPLSGENKQIFRP